ncbi:hydrophobin-like protein [Hyaloscypha finlandica]|nr:hydrophobin-like protein [Hyaloscypha finlandica]
MKTTLNSLIAFSGLIASALTNPLLLRGQNSVCGSIFSSVAKCCSLSIIKVTDLDCSDPGRTPKDKDDFMDICPKGKSPQCCTIPVPGVLGLLCDEPY